MLLDDAVHWHFWRALAPLLLSNVLIQVFDTADACSMLVPFLTQMRCLAGRLGQGQSPVSDTI